MDFSELEKHDRYNRLMRHHRRRIYTFCTFESHGFEDGEDLFQEVAIALWEWFDSLQPEAGPWQEAAWVRRVMANTVGKKLIVQRK